VRIAPLYAGLVVHSRDASDGARILNRLSAQAEEFTAEVRGEQQHLREKFERSEAQKQLIPLAEARENRFRADFSNIVKPNKLGRTVYKDYPLDEIAKYIDWSYFFAAWEIRGRYPAIFDDPAKGEEARKLYADAQVVMQDIIEHKRLTSHAVVGLFPAHSEGDDIVIQADMRDIRMPQLRNQETGLDANRSLADFIAPQGDYIGAFAVTIGGVEALAAEYRARGDEYNAITVKLLGDRLAEAFAVAVHEKIRRELWGFSADEALSTEELLYGKYVGFRPAIGYPAIPDHSLKRELFDLLDVENQIGTHLTESFMMTPAASVSALVLAHPDAGIFGVGTIGEDQKIDYDRRRNR
jgi:5-methyltetrahydrofolate--homocysteine methyltransferase